MEDGSCPVCARRRTDWDGLAGGLGFVSINVGAVIVLDWLDLVDIGANDIEFGMLLGLLAIGWAYAIGRR